MGNGGGGKLMYGKGVGSGDIIRKYTFECGARPAGSTSINFIFVVDSF